ncbi:hypothetical protein A0H81_09508 [Grifola frondosa]|uniref:CxC2-like cysteine cluster KDZ transposase-associated domain-containing protein n=1 Tax=Grifola frondosa TaxID=5627 RepID=A0A1C7M2U0_GRIFR|nr:hypothetical protein A0H81_09508 [Grifola frondosa]
MAGFKLTSKSYISKKVKIRYGGALGTHAAKLRAAQLGAMSFADRQHLMDIDPDFTHLDDAGDAYDGGFNSLPHGEEVMFLSHAEGEEQLCREIFEDLQTKRKRKDIHTHKDRTAEPGMVGTTRRLGCGVPVMEACIAFDVYLNILHSIDKHVATVLHCDTPNWHMCNVCAPCLHALEDKPLLTFAFLATMDENSSLKLVDDTFRGGTSRDDDRLGRSDLWILPADVDHFKHEVKQSKKRQAAASSSFTVDPAMDNDDDDTWLDIDTDSGGNEPTMIFDKLISMFQDKIGLGYDIACAFLKTLINSSLATLVKMVSITSIMPAFHGHSHNHGCQVYWHPMYMEGVRKEDFEGSSVFHRDKVIKQFFDFWDEQKHAEVEEHVYLQSLKSEPPEVALAIDYLKALHRLETANSRSGAAKVEYEKLINNPKHFDDKTSKKILSSYRTILSRVNAIEEEVCVLKSELDIVEWWLLGMSRYKEMSAELKRQEHRVALDNLEHLVVQQLFELTKLGMSGVSYWKALVEYNTHAAALSPPRPQFAWNHVMDMVTLAEFDLLRDVRRDIRALPWAQHRHCEAMNTYFNVKCARKEIIRLNIEIDRLFTLMIDNHVNYYRAIAAASIVDLTLAHELLCHWLYLDHIHENVAHRLFKTSQLHGFCGRLRYGCRVGQDTSLINGIPLPLWATYATVSEQGMVTDVDDDLTDHGGIPGQ